MNSWGSCKARTLYRALLRDQAYIGRCPDLFHGGVHGDDPLKVARELQKVINEWEAIYEGDSREMPPVRVKQPMELV